MTIGKGMVAVGSAAALIVSPREEYEHVLVIALLALATVVPPLLLIRFGRAKSASDVLVAALAMTYLGWAARFRFWPERPRLWYLTDRFRWNLGLLAILYAVLLAEGVTWSVRHSTAGGSLTNEPRTERAKPWFMRPEPVIEAVTLVLLCRVWAGWLTVAGLVALVFIAWARRRRRLRLSRVATRIAYLGPGAATGLLIGLAWTWLGWPCGVGLAVVWACLALVRLAPSGTPRPARRWAPVLAVLWTFAISAQVVETPTATVTTGRGRPRFLRRPAQGTPIPKSPWQASLGK